MNTVLLQLLAPLLLAPVLIWIGARYLPVLAGAGRGRIYLLILLCGGAVAVQVGIGPYGLMGPLAFAAVFLFDGIQKGQGGFINHAQFGILYGALLLALSPAGDALTPFGWNAGSGAP